MEDESQFSPFNFFFILHKLSIIVGGRSIQSEAFPFEQCEVTYFLLKESRYID